MTRPLPPDTPTTDGGPRRRLAGVVAVALLGLLLAAGVTYAASRLVSEPIGLPAAPGALGTELAPETAAVATTSTSAPTSTQVRTVTITKVTPPVDPRGGTDGDDAVAPGDADHGGDGHGSDGDD